METKTPPSDSFALRQYTVLAKLNDDLITYDKNENNHGGEDDKKQKKRLLTNWLRYAEQTAAMLRDASFGNDLKVTYWAIHPFFQCDRKGYTYDGSLLSIWRRPTVDQKLYISEIFVACLDVTQEMRSIWHLSWHSERKTVLVFIDNNYVCEYIPSFFIQQIADLYIWRLGFGIENAHSSILKYYVKICASSNDDFDTWSLSRTYEWSSFTQDIGKILAIYIPVYSSKFREKVNKLHK
jgi:hypothetical protein